MKKIAILLSLIVSVNAQIGDVTTFAGSGTAGAVDGVGTAASFNYPPSVVVKAGASYDTLFVIDYRNNLIRKIHLPDVYVGTLAGSGEKATKDGFMTSAAFNNPAFGALDNSGNFSLNLSIIVLLESLKKVLILYSIFKLVVILPVSEFFTEFNNF